MKYILEFDIKDENWEPLKNPACWCECPLSCLTKIGEICHAKQAYDEYNLIICPMARGKIKKHND